MRTTGWTLGSFVSSLLQQSDLSIVAGLVLFAVVLFVRWLVRVWMVSVYTECRSEYPESRAD